MEGRETGEVETIGDEGKRNQISFGKTQKFIY